MRTALEHLAARHGLATATEATMVLRQALDRTISSDEVRGKIAAEKALRTAEQWRDEVQIEHAIEKAYTAFPPDATN